MVVVIPGAAAGGDEVAVGQRGEPREQMRHTGEQILRQRAVGEEVRVEWRGGRKEPAWAGVGGIAAGGARRARKRQANRLEDDRALVGVQMVVGVPAEAVEAGGE